MPTANNNYADVVPRNENEYGKGWVKASLSNGVTLTEYFSFGKPDVSNLDIRSLRTYNLLGGQWAELFLSGYTSSVLDPIKVHWSFDRNINQRGEDFNISIQPPNLYYNYSLRVGAQFESTCGYSATKYKTFRVEYVNDQLDFGTQF